MGHKYAGIVEEAGREVTSIKPGQSAPTPSSPPSTPAGSARPDTLARACAASMWAQAARRLSCCMSRSPTAGSSPPQASPDDLILSLLTASDVLGTSWFGAVAVQAAPGKTVTVVGDGAAGLLAVLAAKQPGADRITAMSRHEPR